jgi:hypothetical protein
LQVVAAVTDATLDAGDMCTVEWPDTGATETVQIQSLDHTLGGSDETQTISCVSNRTDEDLS